MLETALKNADARRKLPSPPMRRALREQAGLSQETIADAVGVQRSAVSRWESGSRTPRGNVALTYAAVLNKLAIHIEKAGR